MLYKLDEIVGAHSGAVTCTFVGGNAKRDLQNVATRMLQISRDHGLRGVPWILVLLIFALPTTLLVNLVLHLSGPRRSNISDCTSVAIRFASVREAGKLI
jgi:hypothetical protein